MLRAAAEDVDKTLLFGLSKLEVVARQRKRDSEGGSAANGLVGNNGSVVARNNSADD